MKTLALSVCLFCAASAAAQTPAWKQRYAGADATGPGVLALWQFLPGQETQDNSGKGHVLTLRGDARFADDGPVEGGRCLESFATDPKNEKAQGAVVAHHPGLTPAGAFTLELWIKPKPGFEQQKNMTLLDKMYINYKHPNPTAECQRDYMLSLDRTGDGSHVLAMFLGHGETMSRYASSPLVLKAGEWRHVTFTYNGAGQGRFFLDGKDAGRTEHKGCGPVVGGKYSLALGDRSGSSYIGFHGFLAQVRLVNGISPAFAGRLSLRVAGGRRVFERFEDGARLKAAIVNDGAHPVEKARVTAVADGRTGSEAVADVVPAGGEASVDLPLDTRLRPDSYTIRISVVGVANGREVRGETETPVTITLTPRLPPRLPVVLWGADNSVEIARGVGFTHQIFCHAWYEGIWKAGAPGPATTASEAASKIAVLDKLLLNGMAGVSYTYEHNYIDKTPELIARFGRVDRTGKPYPRKDVCGHFKEMQDFAYNTGASLAVSYGAHPAFQASLIHSEVRDEAEVCFHELDKAAFRQSAGADIPPAVSSKYGLRYRSIAGFPTNRIVPDTDPILAYYRWYWKDGDAWNLLHTRAHEGLKAHGVRKDFWTFFDPANRAPSVWGSGGKVDVLSSWTYVYPDPPKIGQSCDELFALAEGTGQKVMKMTQIIWYRKETAPKDAKPAPPPAEWEKTQPAADFITIAPDHLREAFWHKIARPVQGIMYHGWASMEAGDSHGAYKFTDGRAKEALTQLTRDVARPLGPMLLQVPDRPADVAILQSFASQIFAGRGTLGWSAGWDADIHLVLQWAQIQPRILYEETVLRDGLNGIKVLVLANCDVLPQSVFDKIKAWQKTGGVVVGDTALTPAVVPDILLTPYLRTRKAEKDKAALQAMAGRLRQELDAFYTRYAESSNPDVITRTRRYGETDYVFAINDKRVFGGYVGHHGLVMEDGVAASATMTLRRPGAVVYDPLARVQVKTQTVAGATQWQVDLGPGEGRVYLVTPRPIASVVIRPPEGARLGGKAAVGVAVLDDRGQPVPAVLPLRVDVLDPQGRAAEFSGFYGARDGRLSLELDLAVNDLAGQWKVKVVDLASGLSQEAAFGVAALAGK